MNTNQTPKVIMFNVVGHDEAVILQQYSVFEDNFKLVVGNTTMALESNELYNYSKNQFTGGAGVSGHKFLMRPATEAEEHIHRSAVINKRRMSNMAAVAHRALAKAREVFLLNLTPEARDVINDIPVAAANLRDQFSKEFSEILASLKKG